MFRYFNPNPRKLQVGDCTIRAIAKATDQTWEETYTALCVEGFRLCDMPSANLVWGSYLTGKGFVEYQLKDPYAKHMQTVEDFCRDHPKGTYILATDGHVLCVENGDWYDSWDSGAKVPLRYWTKEDA